MIVGGWEFVWAAYGVAWSALLLYGISLFARRRAQAQSEGPRS